MHPATTGPEALRAELALRQMSVTALAKVTGIPKATLSAYLRGSRECPPHNRSAIHAALLGDGPVRCLPARDWLVTPHSGGPLPIQPTGIGIDTLRLHVREVPLTRAQVDFLKRQSGLKKKRMSSYPHGRVGLGGQSLAKLQVGWGKKDGAFAFIQLQVADLTHRAFLREFMRLGTGAGRSDLGQRLTVRRLDVYIDFPVQVDDLVVADPNRVTTVYKSGSTTLQVGTAKRSRRISAYDRGYRSGTAAPVTRFEVRLKAGRVPLAPDPVLALAGDVDRPAGSPWTVPSFTANPFRGLQVRALWAAKNMDAVERALAREAQRVGWDLFRDKLDASDAGRLATSHQKLMDARPLCSLEDEFSRAWPLLVEQLRMDLLRGPRGVPWDQEDDNAGLDLKVAASAAGIVA